MTQAKAAEAYKQEYTTLGIALAGAHATAKSQWGQCSITMYDNRLYPYLGCLVDGGTVIDKRTCKDEDIVRHVIAGPMMKEDLPAGHISPPWGERDPIKWDGSQKFSSMDFVALDIYCKYWEDLGARVGIRKGDIIYWNDGESQAIPPIESRWLQER